MQAMFTSQGLKQLHLETIPLYVYMFHSHERPLSGQPGEVEPEELPLEVVVEVDELGVAAGAEVAPRHVDVEHLKEKEGWKDALNGREGAWLKAYIGGILWLAQ